jgi:hypothetical protein
MRQCCSGEFAEAIMNISVPQEAKKRVARSACADAGSEPSRRCPFHFELAAGHNSLDPGRYLILMRQYHEKGNSRRSGHFRSLAGS